MVVQDSVARHGNVWLITSYIPLSLSLSLARSLLSLPFYLSVQLSVCLHHSMLERAGLSDASNVVYGKWGLSRVSRWLNLGVQGCGV